MESSRPDRTYFQNYCLQTDGDVTGDDFGEEDVDGERILNEDNYDDDGVCADPDYVDEEEEDRSGSEDNEDGEGMDDPTDDEVEDDEIIPKPSERGYSRCAKVNRKKIKRKKKEQNKSGKVNNHASSLTAATIQSQGNLAGAAPSQSQGNTAGTVPIQQGNTARAVPMQSEANKVKAGDLLDIDKDMEEGIKDGKVIYKCPCGKQYRKLDMMKRHFNEVHSGAKGGFLCAVCHSDFYYQGTLNAHTKRKFCHRNWYSPRRPNCEPVCEPPYAGGPRMDFSDLNPAEIYVWLLRTVLPIWIKHTEEDGRERFKHRSKKEPWKTFTMSHALRWIALYLARGVLKCHRIHSPWRNHALFNNAYFINNMSGYTWYHILQATCFTNRAEETKPGGRGELNGPNLNRLWRVIDIINQFTECSQNGFNPSKQLCIDEMMSKFLGFFQWKQNIPHKPVKNGIKSFVLSDAKTGYILGFIPAVKQPFHTFAQFGATASAVWALLTSELTTYGCNFLHKGHYLFTDSYYTMFSLIEQLYKMKTYYCGTISKARQLPPGFVEKVLPDGKVMERGDSKHLHTEIITLTHWVDNGSVRIASSLPDIVDEPAVVTRKIKDGNGKWTQEEFPCPKVVQEYNKYMGGVDLADQLLAATHVHIRQVRWYITIWFRILEMAMLNAYIIYQATFPADDRLCKDRLQFHIKVIEGLMAMADEIDGVVKEPPPPPDQEHDDEGSGIDVYNLVDVRKYHDVITKRRLNTKLGHFPTYVARGSCVLHGNVTKKPKQDSFGPSLPQTEGQQDSTVLVPETKESEVACATKITNRPIMPQTEGQEQSTVIVHPEASQTLGAELVAKEKDGPPTSETKGHETTIVSESTVVEKLVEPEQGTGPDAATEKYDPWWTTATDEDVSPNNGKPVSQTLITDFFKTNMPRVRRTTSADTVILPTTVQENDTEFDRSLSIGFVWQESDQSVTSQLSTDSEIHRFRLKNRRQQMRDGELPLQHKITTYMPDYN